MVVYYDQLNRLSFSKLMSVYEESNCNVSKERYAHLDRKAAILSAEQDFYAFLADVFFQTENARYAILEVEGNYCSAVRIEPYRDGLLLTGLETAPAHRSFGQGKRLVEDVIAKWALPVYSHVAKDNAASLKLHMGCGFCVVEDYAVFLDGSRTEAAYTLCYNAALDEKDIDK